MIEDVSKHGMICFLLICCQKNYVKKKARMNFLIKLTAGVGFELKRMIEYVSKYGMISLIFCKE